MTALNIEAVPASLRDIPQWLLWRREERNDKQTKVPYSIKGHRASSTDPATWAPFETVARALHESGMGYDGAGFVLTPETSIVGVDLDKCRDLDTGDVDAWAKAIVSDLNSYTEISPSGTGLRIFTRGKIPPGGRKKGSIEVYDRERFLTVTGNKLADAPAGLEERTTELAAFHLATFGPPEPETVTPVNRAPVPIEDADLIARMLASSAGDTLQKLWEGDWSGFSSQSSADLRLCSALGFWTNGDAPRMDRLFRTSGLMRGKWDERRGERTYGQRTIAKAIRSMGEGYSPDIKLTDLGNARRLVRAHGDDIRFNQALGWLVYDGKHWVRDETGTIERLARDVPRELFSEAARVETRASKAKNPKKVRARATALRKHAERTEGEPSLRRLVKLAQSEPGIGVRVDELDRDPWLLNVENGTVDLKTGTLRLHRREDLMTKLAPVAFDPEAKAPIWEKFIQRVTDGNEALAGYIQRIAGYSLTGDASEQVIFLFHGHGANGKSTFIATFSSHLGDYALAAQFNTFTMSKNSGHGPRGDIARMRGARLVSAVEPDESGTLAMGMLKQLSGGDAVVAAFKFKDEFQFIPQFKLILAANERPTIRSNDYATWRRIKLVPWTVTIPAEEKDPHLKEKLTAEGPGILAWAVRGCLDWQRRGLAEPEAVTRATGEYRADEDDFGTWVAEHCLLAPNGEVGARALYESYAEFTRGRGSEPISEKKFSGKLAGLKIAKRHTKTGARWAGIALRPVETATGG